MLVLQMDCRIQDDAYLTFPYCSRGYKQSQTEDEVAKNANRQPHSQRGLRDLLCQSSHGRQVDLGGFENKPFICGEIALGDFVRAENYRVEVTRSATRGKMIFDDVVAIFRQRSNDAQHLKPGAKIYREKTINALIKNWPQHGTVAADTFSNRQKWPVHVHSRKSRG
jgi:hypothetical protein